jgi:hypothetical protein
MRTKCRRVKIEGNIVIVYPCTNVLLLFTILSKVHFESHYFLGDNNKFLRVNSEKKLLI